MKPRRSSGLSIWRREYPVVLVLLTIVLWLWPVIGGRSTLFYRDLYLQHAGTARLLSGEILPDRPLLWDPLLNGGQPLLGNPNRFVLYPSRILYRFFSAVTGLNLEIVLHFLVGALGVYLLVRYLGPGPWPAALAAFAWSLGGLSISLSNHMGRFFAFHWMPWIVLTVEGLTRDGRRGRWWIALVMVSCLQWLTGGFEIVVLTGVLVVFWVVVGASPDNRWILMRRSLSALVVAPLLMAFQVIPMAAMVLRSARAGSLGASSILFWSLHPFRLVETVVPGCLGSIDIPELTGRYWGEHLVDNGVPYFVTLYLGISVLLLAATGVLGDRHRHFRHGLAVMAFLGGVLALGRYNPLLHWLAENLSQVIPVRFPIKATALAALPLAVLAAFGLEATRDGTVRVFLFRLAAAASALLLVAWAWLGPWHTAGRRWLESFFGGTAPGMEAGVANALGHSLVVSLLMTLVLVLPFRRLVVPAMTVLVASDLLTAATGFVPLAPRWILEQLPPAAKMARTLTRSGRFFRTADPVPQGLRVPANRAWGSTVANLSSVSNYLAASYGIPTVFHHDDPGLASARYAALNGRVAAMPLEMVGPILELANVESVMWWQPVKPPWLSHAITVPTHSMIQHRISRTAFPHETVWFVPWSRWVSGTEQAVNAVSSPGFDPRYTVILERPPSSPGLWHGPNELIGSFRCEAPGQGWLYVSIPWMPGMEIVVDGRSATPNVADVAFMAVPVTKGHHTVRVVYRPPELLVGICVSLGTLLVLLIHRARKPDGATR